MAAGKPLTSTGCSPSSEQPRGRGDVRTASSGAKEAGPGRCGPWAPGRLLGWGQNEATGARSTLPPQQNPANIRFLAGPPELGSEGWKRRRRAPTTPAPVLTCPWPGQGLGDWMRRRGHCAEAAAGRGRATRPPSRPLRRPGGAGRGWPQATRSLDAWAWTWAQRPEEPSLSWPAPRLGEQGTGGRLAGALCNRGDPEVVLRGGTLQGEPYTGAQRGDTGRKQAAWRLHQGTPRHLTWPRPGRFLKGTAALSPRGTRCLWLRCVEWSWRGRCVDRGDGQLRGRHREASSDRRAVRPAHRLPQGRAAPRPLPLGAAFICE